MNTQRQQHIAVVQMLLCAALWSIAGILIKLVPWNSFVIAGLRSGVCGLVVLAYMRLRGLRLVVSRRTVLPGLLMAALFFSFVGANKLTTAANAIALQYTAPLFLMGLSAVFLHERLKTADVIAALVTFGGVVLFFLDQLDGGKVVGNIVAICSGVFFALMYLFLGQLRDLETRMSYVFLGQMFTLALSLPFFFLYPPELTGTSVACILVLGVVQLGIPYVLVAVSAQHCPPAAQSLLSALEPILTPVWVLLFYGERPGRMALLGGAIVIAAVTLWTVLGHLRGARGEVNA